MKSHKSLYPHQLLKFTRVIPQLGYDKLRAGIRLAAQFGVLGKTFRLGIFKRGNGAAAQKTVRITGIVDALAQHGHQALKGNGIQVEYRRTLSGKALSGIVSSQSQYIFHTHHGKLNRPAFQSDPIHIPTGKVDDHIHTEPEDFRSQNIRAKRGVATGIVRHGHGGNAAIRESVCCNPHDRVNGFSAVFTAWHQLQCNDKLTWIKQIIPKNTQHD